jgi:hypothetical protein
LANELFKLCVGRVPRNRLMQGRDGHLRLGVPVAIQSAVVRVEEQHSRDVRPNPQVRGVDVDMAGQQRVSEAVPREDVGAVIDHDRRCSGHGGEQFMY